MDRTRAIATTLGLTIGSALYFAWRFESSPAFAIFFLLFGLITAAVAAAVLMPESLVHAHKTWDHLGRDIEELHTRPSTIGDKVRGLEELREALYQKFAYNDPWIARLREALAQINTLISDGNAGEATKLARAEIAHAYDVLALPRIKLVQARLAKEARLAEVASRVEFAL